MPRIDVVFYQEDENVPTNGRMEPAWPRLSAWLILGMN